MDFLIYDMKILWVKSCSEIVKRACSFNRYLRVRMYLLTYVYYTYAEKVCKRKLLQIFYMPTPCLLVFIHTKIEKKCLAD